MRKREAYQLGAASSRRHLRNPLRPCPVQRARGRGPAGALDFVSLFHLYHGPPDRLPQGPITELAVDGFVVMDMVLFMVLIWSFHIQYIQPAPF